MFQCPDCLIELRRAKSALGNAWGCPQCRGRVLGMAFLRRTLDKTAVNTLWQAAREADATQGKACPGCGRPMREVTITAAETPLQLDVCCSCQFVWFDNLEFEQIPAAPEEAPPLEREILPPRAREALAMMQVQSIQEKLHREDVEPNSGWWTWPALFGLPVEMDGAALRHLPWVTWLLGTAILAVGIWSFPNLETLVPAYGLIPAEVLRGDGVTLFTAFFLHGGWLHLLSNLYFLLIFGDNVEDTLGPFRYLLLLICATLLGHAAHIALDPASTVPCIGASGGISGIILYYALQFPHARLGFLMRYHYRCQWIGLPALAAAGLWILLQLWGALGQWGGFSHVSALAHLGGAAAGLGMWLLTRSPSPAAPLSHPDRSE